MKKVWFITGAGRGLGFEIAKAALAAGDSVIATGRDPEKVATAFGTPQPNLLVQQLDVSAREQAAPAVEAALQRFGRIDVLVNNAGYGHLGMFEESTPEDVDLQFRVNLYGSFDITRAVLPTMRRQRSGHIFNITSIGGLRGGAMASLYCATKFALEGWSESLAAEVGELGLHVTAVEPGFFRTDFLDSSSIRYTGNTIADYVPKANELRSFYDTRSYQQAGDPAKLAWALLELAGAANPPMHFVVGTDAVGVMEARIQRDTAELAAWRGLSITTDHA